MTDPKQPEAQEAPASEPTQPISLSALKVVVREAFMNGLAWMEANGDSHPWDWGPAADIFVAGWEASEHNPLNYPYECGHPTCGCDDGRCAADEAHDRITERLRLNATIPPASNARAALGKQPTQEASPVIVTRPATAIERAAAEGAYAEMMAEAPTVAQEAPADAKDAARIWIDCEFNEHAGRHELISMGLVADDGREWYEVLPCPHPGAWVAENVIPILGKSPCSRESFSESLREFLAPYPAIHIIADWPSDIALFCDALITAPGCRIDTPPLTLEVIRLDGESELPHNALADARGIRDVHLAALQSHQEGGKP